MTRSVVEERFNVAQKTANRDLSSLVGRDLIEYVPQGRGGHYTLKARR